PTSATPRSWPCCVRSHGTAGALGALSPTGLPPCPGARGRSSSWRERSDQLALAMRSRHGSSSFREPFDQRVHSAVRLESHGAGPLHLNLVSFVAGTRGGARAFPFACGGGGGAP